MTTRAAVVAALEAGRGVLFAEPATVYRPTYSGRDILAPNSSFQDPACVDDRGYVPVEWWIMSKTVALNETLKENEGLTRLRLGAATAFFRDTLAVAEDLLLGAHAAAWPLTKVRASLLDMCAARPASGDPNNYRPATNRRCLISAARPYNRASRAPPRCRRSRRMCTPATWCAGSARAVASSRRISSRLCTSPRMSSPRWCGWPCPHRAAPRYNLALDNVITRLGL